MSKNYLNMFKNIFLILETIFIFQKLYQMCT